MHRDIPTTRYKDGSSRETQEEEENEEQGQASENEKEGCQTGDKKRPSKQRRTNTYFINDPPPGHLTYRYRDHIH